MKLAIWLFGVMLAAIIVFPDLTRSSLFAGLGIGPVAIGFAFQDIFENFLAGVLIMLREKMRIGDTIECEGIIGKVEHITLRETHIRALSGELTVVPNSILFKNPVEILTDQDRRHFDVVVGVAYDSNLDQAAEVIRKSVENVDGIILDEGSMFSRRSSIPALSISRCVGGLVQPIATGIKAVTRSSARSSKVWTMRE